MPEEEKTYTVKEYILFKLDRNLAILGLIIIAITSVWMKDVSEAAGKIIAGVVGALAVYLGARGGNN